MNRRNFILGGAGALLLLPTTDILETSANADTDPALVSSHWPSTAEWAMLEYINDYRASMGRARLEMSRSLAAAAHHHAWYMSQTDDVDHTLGSVTWEQNIYNYGYPVSGIGENVAAGRSSASGTLQQWKESTSHNANLLRTEWIRCGVGRVYNPSGNFLYYWCATFGSVSHRTIYQ